MDFNSFKYQENIKNWNLKLWMYYCINIVLIIVLMLFIMFILIVIENKIYICYYKYYIINLYNY